MPPTSLFVFCFLAVSKNLPMIVFTLPLIRFSFLLPAAFKALGSLFLFQIYYKKVVNAMYKKTPNAIQRERLRNGITQEALAERIGYSTDAVKAWENGSRFPSANVVDMLADCLQAPWLAPMCLREQSEALAELVPDFTVDRPVAEAAANFINCVLDMVDLRFDRQLLKMVADGRVDEVEEDMFQAIMEKADEVCTAYFELKFSKGGIDNGDDHSRAAAERKGVRQR